MNEVVIETKKFKEELSKASSDCWIKSSETRTYAITLDRIIEVAFDCLIETQGSWSHLDPIKVLEKKLFQHGFKEMPQNTVLDLTLNYKKELEKSLKNGVPKSERIFITRILSEIKDNSELLEE